VKLYVITAPPVRPITLAALVGLLLTAAACDQPPQAPPPKPPKPLAGRILDRMVQRQAISYNDYNARADALATKGAA
jgi:hypothetical protein